MEGESQCAKLVSHRMTAQDLDRDNQRVPHQVRIDHTMKDVNRPVIRCTSHERVPMMESHGTQGALVVFESLVRRMRQVQIKPNHATVKTPNNQVISTWMDIERRDPTTPRYQAYASKKLDPSTMCESTNESGTSSKTKLFTDDLRFTIACFTK
jgi:hypothetical protein